MARPCGYACMRSTTTAWASSTTREPVHVPHQEKHRLGNEGVGRAPRVDLFSMSWHNGTPPAGCQRGCGGLDQGVA
jgi:hypothetical protein